MMKRLQLLRFTISALLLLMATILVHPTEIDAQHRQRMEVPVTESKKTYRTPQSDGRKKNGTFQVDKSSFFHSKHHNNSTSSSRESKNRSNTGYKADSQMVTKEEAQPAQFNDVQRYPYPYLGIGYSTLAGADYRDVSGGIGVELSGHYFSSPQFSLGGGISLAFPELKSGEFSGNLTFVSLYAEPRYLPSALEFGNFQPFASSRIGIAFQKRVSGQLQNQSFEQNLSGWGFLLEGGTGVNYHLSRETVLNLKLGVGYISFGDLSGYYSQNGFYQSINAPPSTGRSYTFKIGILYRIGRH